jgi:hypothetical protein
MATLLQKPAYVYQTATVRINVMLMRGRVTIFVVGKQYHHHHHRLYSPGWALSSS